MLLTIHIPLHFDNLTKILYFALCNIVSLNLDLNVKISIIISRKQNNLSTVFSEVFMQNFVTLTGHALGFIAVILFFYSYQVKSKRSLMTIQTVATALSCIQYLLIGALSGFSLNIVCIIRNFIFYFRDKKQSKNLISPVLLSLCIAGASILSWEGTHSLLITLGLVVNTMCMGLFDARTFRKTILISSSLILVYNIFAASYSGMLSESISLISVIIGIVRYRSTQQPVSTKKTLAA